MEKTEVNPKVYVGAFLLLLGLSLIFGGFMTNINTPAEFQYVGNNYMIIGAICVFLGIIILATSVESKTGN